MTTPIVGPVPPYSNPPIEPQFFQPSVFVISALTLGITTIVTTTVDHNYVFGQEVRLLIPEGCGCIALNGKTAYVVSIPADNEVELNLLSIGIDPFVTKSGGTQPQIIAIGDINMGIVSSTGVNIPTTNIPGAFINISPL